MSETPHISIYPDSQAQKQRIESLADKHNMSVSEYCLMAIERQNAQESEAERVDEMDIETRLEDLKTSITQDIEAVMDIDLRQEDCYEVALWELLAHGYSPERRRKAMEKAPDTLDKQFESIAEKELGGEQ